MARTAPKGPRSGPARLAPRARRSSLFRASAAAALTKGKALLWAAAPPGPESLPRPGRRPRSREGVRTAHSAHARCGWCSASSPHQLLRWVSSRTVLRERETMDGAPWALQGSRCRDYGEGSYCADQELLNHLQGALGPPLIPREILKGREKPTCAVATHTQTPREGGAAGPPSEPPKEQAPDYHGQGRGFTPPTNRVTLEANAPEEASHTPYGERNSAPRQEEVPISTAHCLLLSARFGPTPSLALPPSWPRLSAQAPPNFQPALPAAPVNPTSPPTQRPSPPPPGPAPPSHSPDSCPTPPALPLGPPPDPRPAPPLGPPPQAPPSSPCLPPQAPPLPLAPASCPRPRSSLSPWAPALRPHAT